MNGLRRSGRRGPRWVLGVFVSAAGCWEGPPALPSALMVVVPGGVFHRAEHGDQETTQPQGWDVQVDTFYIDINEVTVADYRECVEAGECALPGAGDRCNDLDGRWDHHPVNCVTWLDAKNYCEWTNGGTKRLPTEAEWEKAARGTDSRTHPWGDAPDPSCRLVVMDDPAEGGDGCGDASTAVVGSRPLGASPYGVHDMGGNVVEWVADWFGAYDQETIDNPKGPATGMLRTIRGGSWVDRDPGFFRTTFRNSTLPETQLPHVGFRCVMPPRDDQLPP